MDYEKKYKEAVNKIKNLLDDGEKNGFTIVTYKTDLESIFPELKESEDEKIRKTLIDYFNTCAGDYYGELKRSSILAWLEKQAEVESDNDDIEVEEKGIREAFNKIEDEKQCKQKPFDYKNQGTQNSHKFNIGDIISNGNVEFRIDNIVKNCVGQDCYFLVDVESEKNGTRYLTMCVRGKKTSHMGETTWLCEQVDKSFKKQGEQKPADKVEPKFKVGDWIISKYMHLVMQIINNDNGSYKTVETDGTERNDSYDFIERNFKLWTIQDAKDGDVLASKDKEDILIHKSNSEIELLLTSYISFSKKEGFCPRQYSAWDSNEFIPAIKKQRDLLFSKMREAGYEWDDDKKELKKISQRMISAEAKEAMYAKTAWSEDDEKMLVDAYVMLDWYKGNNWWTARRIKDWLETLKQRIGG